MDEPNLYTVTARLQKNNETFHEIYANVGVRSYTAVSYTHLDVYKRQALRSTSQPTTR